MKRFLTLLSRLLFVIAVAVAFILLGILVMRVEDLATQVAALSTRVHELEQATPGSAGSGRGSQTGGSQGVAPSRTPTPMTAVSAPPTAPPKGRSRATSSTSPWPAPA